MSEVVAHSLLKTPSVAIRDICCPGGCRHQSAEEYAVHTHLVFPIAAFMSGISAATPPSRNQVLFFNPLEGYRVSHPVSGGDACIDLVVSEPLLAERATGSAILATLARIGGRMEKRRTWPCSSSRTNSSKTSACRAARRSGWLGAQRAPRR